MNNSGQMYIFISITSLYTKEYYNIDLFWLRNPVSLEQETAHF